MHPIHKAPIRRVCAWIRYKASSNTIRERLFIAFILMVFLTTLVFISISILVGIRNGQRQVIDKLESVATLKEAELNNWAAGLRSDLAAVIVSEEEHSFALEMLAPSKDPIKHEMAYRKLNERLSLIVHNSKRLDEIFLIDLQRQVVLSTDHWREGGYATSESNLYFSQALKGDYLHPPSYTLSLGGISIIVARPITNDQGEPMGILVGRTTTETLNEIMLERAGLGKTGETYLVNRSHIMLTEPRFPEPRWYNVFYVFTDGAKAAIEANQNGYGIYENYHRDHVLGVYHWLPDLEVALLAEQNKAEAMAPTMTTITTSVLAAIFSSLVAGLLALYLSRTITEPLANLVKIAKQVTDGDIQQVATVVRHDEIGVLAEAFNRMTDRLRELINNLEAQVKERTESLQWQTLKLETSTKVSREITSILDLDELLNRVVELIQQAYKYDHVAIYLGDQGTRNLDFVAGTGEISQVWRSNRRHLSMDSGSHYGEVVLNNHSLLINDVSQDPRFIAENALPETSAECITPLRIRDWVLGILVVQSKEKNYFLKEDIEILQNLGDQVAIAIENARLYHRVRLLATLEERQRLARELHDYVTQSLYGLVLFSGAGIRTLDANDLTAARQYMVKISGTANQVLKEMRLLLYQLRKTELDRESLACSLRQRLETVETRLGIETQLAIEENLTFSPAIENCLGGIAQEALNNALRHSDAHKVNISIYSDLEGIKMEIADDGVGFIPEKAAQKGGMGLLGMNERIQQIGGRLTIDSYPGRGTRVCVIIPFVH